MGTKPLVYVAAPYTNPDPVENTHRAIAACDELLGDGIVTPVCPHLSIVWHLVKPRPYKDWLAYDIELLRRCDAVLRLPGESSGADGEVDEAEVIGIPVFYGVPGLYGWAHAQAQPWHGRFGGKVA